MRALFAVSLLVVAAAVLVTPAGGERQADLLIRHGESIGKVKLGMTLPQVRKALGRERAVMMREPRGTRGYRYLELEWDYGEWTVGLMRPPGGRYRAVRITTSDRHERTGEGIGPGVRAKRLFARVPGVHCRFVQDTRKIGADHECVRGRSGGRQTVFLPDRVTEEDPCTYVVTVEVRHPLFYLGWTRTFQPWTPLMKC